MEKTEWQGKCSICGFHFEYTGHSRCPKCKSIIIFWYPNTRDIEQTELKPQRRIVCAAIHSSTDGFIICSARHWDKLMMEQIATSQIKVTWYKSKEGFIDQFGVFVDRHEAKKIAEAANQIIRRCGGDEEELYSENLY